MVSTQYRAWHRADVQYREVTIISMKCKDDLMMQKLRDFFCYASKQCFPGLLCAAYVKSQENSGIVFATRKELFVPSTDKRSSLSYQVVTVAIEMVYLYDFFFLFFSLGIYLWLFSSNRCSSETSVRIRQLWKYLWAEKCRVGINTIQWHGPHPSEVSRMLLNDEPNGNLEGGGEEVCFSYCFKDTLLNIYFHTTPVDFFYNCPLESFLAYKYIFQETKLAIMLKWGTLRF